MAAATEKVKTVFTDDLSKAITPYTQIEVARSLRAEASRIGNPTKKVALLSESIRLSESASGLEDVDRSDKATPLL